MRRARRRAEGTRAWVSSLVRSGLGTPEERFASVLDAVRHDLRGADAEATARAWVEEAEASWRADAATWVGPTDHDRLQEAFTRLEALGVEVLQGCADHWAARERLDTAAPDRRGIAWFTGPDVWHAVDEGMLEVNLWYASGANAAPGDPLLAEVLAVLADAGLAAHFDEGRIEVSAFWQRRPPPDVEPVGTR